MSDINSVGRYKEDIDSLVPDTEDDGSWECSYALNAGLIIINFIEFLETGDVDLVEGAIEYYADTLDFKVQQMMEASGIQRPSESQITNHPIYVNGLSLLDQNII